MPINFKTMIYCEANAQKRITIADLNNKRIPVGC